MARLVTTLVLGMSASTALAACSLQPPYQRPQAPIPADWPRGSAFAPQAQAEAATPRPADLVTDPRLGALIEQALTNNRDLKIAAANILAARAQYRVQKADQLPHLALEASATTADKSASGTTGSGDARTYTSNIAATAFEIDYLGRLRSLSQAALDRYLATEAGAQATRVTLIGDLADAWSTYAADLSLLKLTEDTAGSAQTSVDLTQARLDGGIAPRTDLRQAQDTLATAQADVAQQQTALAQDLNRLQKLVGGPIDPALLPGSIDEAGAAYAQLPAGLSSSLLLRRPDVIQAEQTLKAANADIGAARAALFPTISLSGLAGFSSGALSSLFTGGSSQSSLGAALSLPIFQGGAGRASVAYSKAQRDAAVAAYERVLQTAFQETADALARQGTLDAEGRADQMAVDAAQDDFTLSQARYTGGVDTYLTHLVAQRSLYVAQRRKIALQLTRATNRVALYRALGG